MIEGDLQDGDRWEKHAAVGGVRAAVGRETLRGGCRWGGGVRRTVTGTLDARLREGWGCVLIRGGLRCVQDSRRTTTGRGAPAPLSARRAVVQAMVPPPRPLPPLEGPHPLPPRPERACAPLLEMRWPQPDAGLSSGGCGPKAQLCSALREAPTRPTLQSDGPAAEHEQLRCEHVSRPRTEGVLPGRPALCVWGPSAGQPRPCANGSGIA